MRFPASDASVFLYLLLKIASPCTERKKGKGKITGSPASLAGGLSSPSVARIVIQLLGHEFSRSPLLVRC
jgi:hypothetical protein